MRVCFHTLRVLSNLMRVSFMPVRVLANLMRVYFLPVRVWRNISAKIRVYTYLYLGGTHFVNWYRK